MRIGSSCIILAGNCRISTNTLYTFLLHANHDQLILSLGCVQLIKISLYNTWSVHKMSLYNTWSVHKMSLYNTWSVHKMSLYNTWSGHKMSLYNTWSVHKMSLYSTWSGHKMSLYNTWSVHKMSLYNTWSVHKMSLYNTWSVHKMSLYNTLSVHKMSLYNTLSVQMTPIIWPLLIVGLGLFQANFPQNAIRLIHEVDYYMHIHCRFLPLYTTCIDVSLSTGGFDYVGVTLLYFKIIRHYFQLTDVVVGVLLQELVEKMFEILTVTSADVQREIISCMPEVIEDSQHSDVAKKLR